MRSVLALLVGLSLAGRSAAQPTVVEPSDVPVAIPALEDPFRLGGEIKAGYRWSQPQQSSILDSTGNLLGFMRTPDPGSSMEIQHLALTGEGMITSGVFAQFEVRISDLYNRNPTSTDAQIFIRQAFVRFGRKATLLSGETDGAFYLLFGQAPRFTKQMSRRLESYGMWGTAVGRFEQPQVEIGASFGRHLYARGMVGSGNPLFLRDTNALAGDDLSAAPPLPGGTYETGFPIFYDAKVDGVNLQGHLETGVGLGARWGGAEKGAVDILAWRFGRRLAPAARIRGTEYPAERAVFDGVPFPVTTRGDRRREWGVNVQAQRGPFRLFAQWIDQDLAGVGRHGVEAEGSWTFSLPGLFLVGESPVGNWLQASFRYSQTINEFAVPLAYPRLSVQWPWKKYDLGVRVGVVRDVDLTVEYSVHQVFRFTGLTNLPMAEWLVTLRTGF